MSAGNITVLNLALNKLSGTIDLGSDTFHLVLVGAAQGLTQAFAGAGNAQYSDLTDELATADGYVAGGLAIGSVSWTETGGVATFTGGTVSWTFTGGGVTFKYGAIVDWTSANKDILAFFDASPSGGSVSPAAGAYPVNPAALGFFTLTQTNPQS